MEENRCENCVNFTPKDKEKGICSIPLWENAELYQMHYTRLDEKCNLFEKKN